MKSNKFVFILFLTLFSYGCTGGGSFSEHNRDDFFLICQLRFLDNTGNYTSYEDTRFDELIKYGCTNLVTKTGIAGKPLKYCEIVKKNPINFELVNHIEYSDKWRHIVIEPYQFNGNNLNLRPNRRQVFTIKHPRKPKIISWTPWKKPDFIGDLPETTFVLLGNNKEYLSEIKELPYFEMRYRVVSGKMRWGVLSITNQK